jgi:DNA polymerase-3 subunit gamma/tau
MFLIRLIHLSSLKLKDNFEKEIKIDKSIKNKETDISSKMINQIKNVSQEEKSKPEVQTEVKADKNFIIKSFNDLIEICSNKKEIKLKYELEKNVNLVKFENNRIEISFNESLNKDFVKELSSKLFEWTNERWIITFSQLKGERSVKDQQKNIKEKLIEDSKNSGIYKDVINNFPDAELINVKSKDKGNEHD